MTHVIIMTNEEVTIVNSYISWRNNDEVCECVNIAGRSQFLYPHELRLIN